MIQRRGFTLPEVLIASTILVIALMGVGGMVANLMRKATAPNLAEQATIFASERLAYYRGQVRPYQAVGGTYYPPPERRDQVDINADPTYHNAGYNRHAVLFVREFLYGQDEGQSGKNGATDPNAGSDSGYYNADRTPAAGLRYGRNEVPPTNPAWDRVVANDDRDLNPVPAPVPPINKPGTLIAYAPRANSELVAGSLLGESVKFVREVWVQTNLPYFPAGADANFDATLPAALAPPQIGALPPYTVAVTVRVYPRDRAHRQYTAGEFIGATGTGRGYDRSRPPLAEVSGYFGLRRKL